jgi:hypothetical protein
MVNVFFRYIKELEKDNFSVWVQQFYKKAHK